MNKRQVQHMIDTGFSNLEYTPDRKREVLSLVKGEKIVKKKISTTFVLALVILAIAATTLAATLWPSFIKDKFVTDEPTAHVGMLALIEETKGTELAGEAISDGVAVRTHYAAIDGQECVVLFSMQKATPDTLSISDRLFIAEVDVHFDDNLAARGRCNVTQWYDGDNDTLYCLASTMLEGATLPTTGEVEMILSVITQIPVEGQATTFLNGDPLWEITASVPISGEIPTITIPIGDTITFGQTTLAITEVTLRTTGATVRFEGEIAPSSDGSPQSLMRMFEFEWIDEKGPLSLELTGADRTNIAGKPQGAFIFQGILLDIPQTMSLNVWRRDTPENVQTITIETK